MTTPPSPVPVPREGLLSDLQLAQVLAHDAVAERVLAKGDPPQPGTLVGVRLNLNLLKSTGVALQTLHRPTNRSGYRRNHGFYSGEACGYAQAVRLKNAYFNVSQSGREAIAAGEQHKFAMASVDGELMDAGVPEGFEGVEVRFNPKSHHLFVDANGLAVHSAQEVLILGHRVYARGHLTYHTELTAPARAGDAPSETKVLPAVPQPTLSAAGTAGPPAPRRRSGLRA